MDFLNVTLLKMMKKMNVLVLLICFLGCSAQKNETSWDLVWSDEFNYSGLPDTLNWGYDVNEISRSPGSSGFKLNIFL
jgi:hypothetical protein